MQNIDVRFNATSNFGQVQSELAALQAQAVSLAGAFTKSNSLPTLASADAWRTSQRAAADASRTFRDAASASGLFNTQQIRSVSEAERYTKALQKQKLTFQDMLKHQGIMKQVYQDQLRYQRMTAQYWGTDSAGRAVTDIAIPKNVPRDLDTMGQRMRFFGDMTKSAGAQMINLGKNVQWAGRQLTVGFTYPLVLFGAAAGVASYQVEDAFAKINKVYDISAAAQTNEATRTKELAQVRVESMEMAREVAEKYGLTVQKTLAVEQALAATGLTTKDGLIELTKEVQRISALGDIDPTQTTDMVVALTTAFKLKADEVTQTLNFMNATSNATSLSLQDIAEATPRAASGLAALGVTAEEMTILLVSMREAGVDAAEGANALKSATTRIVNPAIVKKTTELFKNMGASINVGAISNKAGGNLMEFIKMLGKAMAANDQLTKKQKATAMGALFGTYQFNRLNASLVNVGDAYSGVNNQTAKAIELQNKSAKELANTAKISEDLMMNNPAGQFRKEWAKLTLELSEMGKPFLEIATSILSVFTTIGEGFNSMDEWKKKVLLGAAIITGLAGPLIMVSGLFLNLFGFAMKGIGGFIATLGRLTGARKLVNKEEQAAMLTAEAQNAAMQKSIATTSTLAREVQVLAAAYAAATKAAKAHATAQGLMPATRGSANQYNKPIGPKNFDATPVRGQGLPAGGYYFPSAAEANAYYSQAKKGEDGIYRKNVDRIQAARVLAGQQERALTQSNAQKAVFEKMKNSVNGISLGMGVMGAATALMLANFNETTNSIAKWLMIGTLVVPAIRGVVVATQAAATAAAAYAANMRAAALAGGGKAGMAKSGIKGALVGIGGLAASASGLALGITAVLGGTYLIAKKVEDSRRKAEAAARETRENQAEILDLTEAWAEATGKAYKNYQRYNAEGTIDLNRKEQSSYDQSVAFYSTPNEEGGGKEQTDEFLNMADSDRKFALMYRLSELIDNVGLKSKQARQEMIAFLDAAGMSITDAADMIDEAMRNLTKGGKTDFGALVTRGLDTALRSENHEYALKAGENAGRAFQEGFAQADDKGKYLDRFQQKFLNQWEGKQEEIKQWFEQRGGMTKVFTEAGLNSDQVQAAVDKFNYFLNDVQAFRTEMFKGGLFEGVSGLEFDTPELIELERAFFGAAAQSRGLGKDVDTMNHFLSDTELIIARLNKGQKGDYLKSLYVGIQKVYQKINQLPAGALFDPMRKELLKQKDDILNIMNAVLKSMGLKQGRTGTEAFFNYFYNKANKAKDKADEIKDAIDSIRGKTVDIRINQVGGIMQTAMGNVQQAMADSAMDSFNAGWDQRIAGVQASQEAAANALERRQQNAMDAFDARWEKRREAVEKAYQDRIDRINKEIEAEQKANDVRQRLFDKEMERLRRIAERANTNIDFNVAVDTGELDEAAKIYNNSQAQGTIQQMEDEQKAAEARAAAKIAALEKKNERLEKQRDKELKQLQKMEDRMRKHLERVQDARRNALEKQQQDVMSSLDQQRQYEEATLQQRLDLFVAYTARNKRDLERWMRELGFEYDDFGQNVMQKGQSWARSIRQTLLDQLRLAGMEVANDNIWEQTGRKISEKLLRGLGFDNLGEFRRFIATGKMPGAQPETNHGGGMVGAGGSGRGGIAANRGWHPSEMMVRAQKGEYIINRKAARANMPLLKMINKNGMIPGVAQRPGPREGIGAVPAGEGTWNQFNAIGEMVGLIAGAESHMWRKGLAPAYDRLHAIGLRKQAANERRASRQQSNGPGVRNVNIPDGIDPRGAAAIRWAESMFGTTGWYNRCLSFVRQSFGAPGGVYDAKTSWNQARNKYSASGGVPAGVPVFWTTGTNGHVALSIGGGRAISTDNPIHDQAGVTSIANLNSWLGSPPAGWSADINGTQVYPSLRTGGRLRHDTLIQAHRGETVLDAPLTKQFRDNVASGGGNEYNVTLDLRGAYIKDDTDITKAMDSWWSKKEAKLGRKRVVR